jgi:hypothetical protein
MLPFGHIAAGYLIANTVLETARPELAASQIHSLTLWGIFFAFAPDLDMFYAFWKAKSLTVPDKNLNHRDYLTHRPLLWLAAGSALFILGPTAYWRYFGLLLWLCSWSHFLLDSGRTGVRWFWPMSRRFFALKEPGATEDNPIKGFFRHWFYMLRMYKKRVPLIFYLEIVIVATAILKIINIF